MGTKTSLSIRKEVIRRWLKGHSRDQIAREVDIWAGTVSSIIKECKQNDPDFDLLRQVSFIIKNKGLDLNFLASSIRLRKIFEDNGLNEEQVESFIEKIEVHCFKGSLKVDEFINLISNISDISDNLDVTPVPEDKLAIVNKKLDILTDPKELADLMKDFRQHLGKYPDIINLMRKRRSYSFLDSTKRI